MATTEFKGPMDTGAIKAKFLSDFSNVDSDLLSITFAPKGGGQVEVDQAVAVPGGFADVGANAPGNGRLEIMVATGQSTDSGRLQVFCNGDSVADEPIIGPVAWVFAVGA